MVTKRHAVMCHVSWWYAISLQFITYYTSILTDMPQRLILGCTCNLEMKKHPQNGDFCRKLTTSLKPHKTHKWRRANLPDFYPLVGKVSCQFFRNLGVKTSVGYNILTDSHLQHATCPDFSIFKPQKYFWDAEILNSHFMNHFCRDACGNFNKQVLDFYHRPRLARYMYTARPRSCAHARHSVKEYPVLPQETKQSSSSGYLPVEHHPCTGNNTHTIHVWYIYLHLVDFFW